MKTRNKILIIILLISIIPASTIIMIDFVYDKTYYFDSTMAAFCPYFPISDDFVKNQRFPAVYQTDPIIQLGMLHYHFESLCHTQIGAGAIDLDSNLSPSYAYDNNMEHFRLLFVPLFTMLCIILSPLIITHLILKKKKISSRPYVLFIAASIMLFFGIPTIIFTVPGLQNQPISHFFEPGTFHNFIFLSLSVGLILTIIGIVILYKSKLTRNIIIYLRKRK